jgi:hypothetical protein
MIAVEHLMVRKKLKALIKKAMERNSIKIFTGYVINEMEAIKEIYDPEISNILYDALKDQNISDDLYRALLCIDGKSALVLKYRALKYYSEGELDNFTDIISRNKELIKLNDVHTAFDNLIKQSDTVKAVEYLAKTGIYIENVFKNYFLTEPDEGHIRNLLDLFKSNGSISDLENILNICVSETSCKNCLFLLADLYIEINQKDKLRELITNVNIGGNQYNSSSFEKYYSYLKDYQMVIKCSDQNTPDDILLADAYYHLGEYEKSLKIFKYIYYNRDKNILDRIIEINYALKDYYSIINYVGSLENTTKLTRKFYLYKIEGEINLDLYNEAEYDINRYRTFFEEDSDILGLLIKYYKATDNPEMSYRTVLNLIEKGYPTLDNYKIVLNYLYSNEEYGKIISYIEEKDLVSEFKPMYCSSLVYSEKVDEAVKYLSEDKLLLDSGLVVDSLFAKIKTNERIKKFNGIDKSGTLLEMILLFIQGRKNVDYMKYMLKIYDSKSLACIYILASSTKGNEPFGKTYVRKLLGVDKYQVISSVISSVSSVRNEGYAEDLSDSRYFLYPVTRSLIDSGNYNDAGSLLDSLHTKSPDAFYYYFRSYIEFLKSDFPDAVKHIEKAISILDNVDFLALRINIGLSKNENVGNYINSAIELGFDDIFILINEFMENKKIQVNDSFVDFLKEINIKNLSLYRLKRYCFKDYVDKLKFSALSVFYGGTSEDIVNHYSILKSKDEKIAVSFLELYKNKKYISYVILSSYYYSKRILKRSLEYFNLAYVRNRMAIKNPIFQDLVMGNKISGNVIMAMESLNEWFHLTLYYYLRRDYEKVREIVKLHYEDRKIIEFLINHAWESMPLKTFMNDLFNKTHDKILGELLAEKFNEMELYENEIGILKVLINYYPEESSLFDKLLNALIKSGHHGGALDLAYKHFYANKSVSSFNKMVQISYNLRDYGSLVNIFNNNSEFIEKDNVGYLIYCQIKLFNYIGARVTMREYSNLISGNIQNAVNSKLKSSYRTRTVSGYAKKIFETESKTGKLLNIDDFYTLVPEYLINDVVEFITNNEPYSYIDITEYNDQSVNIIKRLSGFGIASIKNIKIYNIYSVTGDVIKSKNFYIFIRRCMEGYYKIPELSGDWHFISKADLIGVPSIMKIIVKYNIGLMDAVFIAGKIKKGMLN